MYCITTTVCLVYWVFFAFLPVWTNFHTPLKSTVLPSTSDNCNYCQCFFLQLHSIHNNKLIYAYKCVRQPIYKANTYEYMNMRSFLQKIKFKNRIPNEENCLGSPMVFNQLHITILHFVAVIVVECCTRCSINWERQCTVV